MSPVMPVPDPRAVVPAPVPAPAGRTPPRARPHLHPPQRRRPRRPPRRGAATLLSVLLLSGLALLASLVAHRGLLTELRGSDVPRRSAQALESAQAGLQWALVQLNAGRSDAACRPGGGAGTARFGERLLEQAFSGRLSPRLDDDGAPLRAGCAWDAGGALACRCAGDGAPTPAAEAPAFSVVFEHAAQTGLVRLVARGCAGCGDGALDARAQAQALLAFVPALTGLPAAPLTVRGDLGLGSLALQPLGAGRDGGGLLLHAGGAVRADAGSAHGSVNAYDAGLALPPGRLVHRYLGLAPADFAGAPGVQRLRCGGDCAGALQDAVARGAQALWIEGDLALPNGAALGSAEAPVLLAVQGRALLGPGLRLNGLLAAGGLRWQARDGDFIRGAVLIDGDCCEGSGAPVLMLDTALLRRLAQQAGRFVPVPGGWKDFS